MEANLVTINSMLEALCQKMDTMNVAIHEIRVDNAAVREDLAAVKRDNVKKDEQISQLQDQVNKLDQASRSTSVRILGLPVNTAMPNAEIRQIVYKEIILPIIEASKDNGDVPSTAHPHPHLMMDNVFAIPAKKDQSSPVILKLSSQYLRNLIFYHKKEALPKMTDPTTHKMRGKYTIFEDLSPANYTLFRSFANDKQRVKSVWSFGGQIRYKLHDNDFVYKCKSLNDTVESLSKQNPAAVAASINMSQ
jgi:hypothetical protein